MGTSLVRVHRPARCPPGGAGDDAGGEDVNGEEIGRSAFITSNKNEVVFINLFTALGKGVWIRSL